MPSFILISVCAYFCHEIERLKLQKYLLVFWYQLKMIPDLNMSHEKFLIFFHFHCLGSRHL